MFASKVKSPKKHETNQTNALFEDDFVPFRRVIIMRVTLRMTVTLECTSDGSLETNPETIIVLIAVPINLPSLQFPI